MYKRTKGQADGQTDRRTDQEGDGSSYDIKIMNSTFAPSNGDEK